MIPFSLNIIEKRKIYAFLCRLIFILLSYFYSPIFILTYIFNPLLLFQ